jgi:hypothetical protein
MVTDKKGATAYKELTGSTLHFPFYRKVENDIPTCP